MELTRNEPPLFSNNDIVNKEYYENIKNMINCSICFNIIKDPVQCNKCQHCFCSHCINELRNCPYRCQFNQFNPSLICKNLLSKLIIKCSCGTELNYDSVQKHREKCTNVIYKENYLRLSNQNELLQQESQNLKQELTQLKQELNNCKQELNNYKRKSIANNNYYISDDKQFVSCSLHEHQMECLRRYFNTWYCDKCKMNFEKDIPSYHCSLCDFDLCIHCAQETVRKDYKSLFSLPFIPPKNLSNF